MVNRSLRLLAIAALIGGASPSFAQAWPDRPIRLLVTAPAGNSPDITARLVSEKLDAAFGQRILVENRGGAGGIATVTAVRQSVADGYTLGFLHAAVATITPFTFKAANFDIDRDFEVVGTVAHSPMLFVANNHAPATNLAEAVAHARSRPGAVGIGNPSVNSVPHLAAELLAQRAGVAFQQVPFSSTTQAMQALLNNDIAYFVSGAAPLMPLVRSGKLRAIGLATDTHLPGLEGMPLAKDSIPDLTVLGWFLVFAPKGMPAPLVNRLNAEINRAVQHPDVVKRLHDLGTYPMPGSVAEARAFVQTETARFAKVIREAGIQRE